MCVRQTGTMSVCVCVCRCVCVCVLLVSVCVSLNLSDRPITFSGPAGSLFGFALDFHTCNNSPCVAVGAPKANSSSQSGVSEPGSVFLCGQSGVNKQEVEGGEEEVGRACDVIHFDTEGDTVIRSSASSDVKFRTFKSHQWFGASVRSVNGTHLLACAPLFHWLAERKGAESGVTPVGNCLLLDQSTGRPAHFSPCRGDMMEEDHKNGKYRNDQRYCEVGFSSDVTKEGRVILGAPGGYFFQGQVITVGVSDIIRSGRSQLPAYYIEGVSQSQERGGYDMYRGYSVASGQLTADTITDYLVGVPNDRNTAGTVTVYDGRSIVSLRATHNFHGAQVASYFGHSVAVSDVNNDGLDDVLIGAPLFMDRVTEQLQERGQVVVYLQKKGGVFSSRPDQSLIGFSVYGRFGSALAALGDLDMDGFQDVAIGAPWSNQQGQVFIYRGSNTGLTLSQVLNSPLTSRAAFGFTLRGGTDMDRNGYPDLLVGAWAADRAMLYRSKAVIISSLSLSLMPDFLNPDVKLCETGGTAVSCFVVQLCVHVSGHKIPDVTELEAGLQLDSLKQPMARRTALLSANQQPEHTKILVSRERGVACVNYTAYLRSEEEVRDKLSPIFISVSVRLMNHTSHNALLHGHTQETAQTRIILDCGDDNICIPDLKLNATAASESVCVGGDGSVLVDVSVVNEGEGAFETELIVNMPPHTHYQRSQGADRLVCVQKKENQTVIVTCDLGNPLRTNHKLQTGLLFSVGRLEEVENHISFKLRIRSKNSVNPNSDDVIVKVQVKAEARLEIRGGSAPPDILLPLPNWIPAKHPGSLDAIGPLVEHVYELKNLGPSTVNARLSVDFLSTWRHHFLFYVFSNAEEEALSCRALNASHIDPLQLGNTSSHFLPEASPLVQQGETKTHTQSLRLNCSNNETGCVGFVCDVTALGRGLSAVVRVSARLWTHTLTQNPYVNFELVSFARYDVINTTSIVQPDWLSQGEAQTQLRLTWRSVDGEKPVPVGYIVLSVFSGLFLLSMLSLVFWKLGFFQRNRPPTDEEEEEERLAEESHQ